MVIRLFEHTPLVVISGSMEPTLKVGSLLYYHSNDLDGLISWQPCAYTVEDNIILPIPSKIGYTFAGWNDRVEIALSTTKYYWVVTDYTLTRAEA